MLNKINIGSDHRILRAKVRINTQKERIKLIRSGNKRIKGEEIKPQKIRYAEIVQEQIQEYGMHMEQYLPDINITNTKIIKALLRNKSNSDNKSEQRSNETQTKSRNPTAN